MRHGMKALLIVGLLAAQTALAEKIFLFVSETRNVPFADFIAACDPASGRCNGSVPGPSGAIDLTGLVWASRMEAIEYVVEATGIPVDLTGAFYPDHLWYLECDNTADGCPPEHAIWFDFVDQHRTRLGTSSFSFEGIYRDTVYNESDEGSDALTLYGYNMGEGTSWFSDSSVWLEDGQTCEDEDGSTEDCWNAYGYWIYAPVTEPSALSLLGLGLAGLGWHRRRKA